MPAKKVKKKAKRKTVKPKTASKKAVKTMKTEGNVKTKMPVKHMMTSGKKPKRWIVALLLSIFLGYLGIDRFYLGYVGTGILKLLISILSLGFLSWVWWLVDLILIATKHDFSKVKWTE